MCSSSSRFVIPPYTSNVSGVPSLLCLSFLYMVTDFSAVALPIDVKFYTAVRPHLAQVFSHFLAYSRQQRAVWRDMLLAETLVFTNIAVLLPFAC